MQLFDHPTNRFRVAQMQAVVKEFAKYPIQRQCKGQDEHGPYKLPVLIEPLAPAAQQAKYEKNGADGDSPEVIVDWISNKLLLPWFEYHNNQAADPNEKKRNNDLLKPVGFCKLVILHFSLHFLRSVTQPNKFLYLHVGMIGIYLEQGASSANLVWHYCQEGKILNGLGQVVSACE